MSLVEHAKRELELAGLFGPDSDYGGSLGFAVLGLIEEFENQGHSENSAMRTVELFSKLAQYRLLSPLTGEDDEWNCIFEFDGHTSIYQNNRNSEVFKDGKDGRPYYIAAFLKRTPSGKLWHGIIPLKDGRYIDKCYIKDFKDMPVVCMNVSENEVSEGNWEMWLEDESQLEELAKHYDFEIKDKGAKG